MELNVQNVTKALGTGCLMTMSSSAARLMAGYCFRRLTIAHTKNCIFSANSAAQNATRNLPTYTVDATNAEKRLELADVSPSYDRLLLIVATFC
jgi:hypothetical protein